MPDSQAAVKRALILSGGGGRGAYQVGVWRRLQELGWQPDLVCGTSIGSINGALICSGWDAAQMEQLWASLQGRGVLSLSLWKRIRYRMNRLLGRHPDWPALMDNGPLRRLLAETIDEGQLRDSQPRLAVAATNVRRGMIEYFTGQQLTLEHIVASCAIPVVFPWSEIEGELYWDGGVLSNTPIFPAIEAGASEILVIMLSPVAGQLTDVPRNTREGISRMFDLITLGSAQSLNQSLAFHLGRDLKAHADSLSKDHVLELGDVRVGVVAPKVDPNISTVLDLDSQHIRGRVEAGYADAVEQLARFLSKPG